MSFECLLGDLRKIVPSLAAQCIYVQGQWLCRISGSFSALSFSPQAAVLRACLYLSFLRRLRWSLSIKWFPGDKELLIAHVKKVLTKNFTITLYCGNKSPQIFLKFRIKIMGKLKILCVYKLFPLFPLPSAKGYCSQAKIWSNKIFKVYIHFKNGPGREKSFRE